MSAPVFNFYQAVPKKYGTGYDQTYQTFDEYRIKFPTRMAIVGASGQGKTNIAMNIIYGTKVWTRYYLCVKSPDEPLYRLFTEMCRKLEKKSGREILTVLTDPDELPPVDEFDEKQRTLVLFDDVITDAKAKLKHIANFWVRGRKQGITTMFLSQSFFQIPKLIRDNTDILILRGVLGRRDLKLILSEFASDKTLPELLDMYNKANATNGITDFFLIDKSIGTPPEYRYRHNFAPIE